MGVFAMPSLGADMEAGTLVEWMVKPGDTVKRGDIIAVVETQKGAIEIEVFEAGMIQRLDAELGQELPVGAPLALIGDGQMPDDAGASEPARPPEKPKPAQPAAAVPTAAEGPTGFPPSGGLRASPAARQYAKTHKLDLKTIRGKGPGGAIQLADVQAGSSAPKSSTKPRSAPMSEMRKAIAASMARANREIPHFHVSQTFDLEPASRWLSEHNSSVQPAQRLLIGALYIRAMVIAVKAVPVVNGHYEDDRFIPSDTVNAGMAIALRGGGLVAPAIMDADTMDVAQIMQTMRDLVTRARAGRLRSREMTQGTITVSALGEVGADMMAGVIFPPQVALVGIGGPQRRAWVVGNDVVPRETLTVTLALDHRVGDGRAAATFLAAFENAMQAPETL